MGITNKFVLQDNYSDFGAYFVKKPMPPIKCHLFFKEAGTGPYPLANISGQSRPFQDLCKTEFDAWKVHRDQASSGTSASSAATTAVSDVASRKRRESAAAARDKAKAALSAKRAKHAVTVG